MIVGGYTLDLYCENTTGEYEHDHYPGFGNAQYTGRTFTDCATRAKKDGWLINRSENKAICPKCRTKRRL